MSCRFQGKDGELGHIEDLLVDDVTWTIRYVGIHTRNWWPGGKKVLLAAAWIEEVSWAKRKVTVEIERETVRAAPEYDESQPVDEDFERALVRHYGLETALPAFR